MKITNDLAAKVLQTVDQGLCHGKGIQVPGKMCVEAAVCYAMGLPHSDEPPCVAAAVRHFKITLNDARWSSNQARAKGMRRVAVAQLGSTEIDQNKFAAIVALETIRQILPVCLLAIGLPELADACKQATDLKSGAAAARAAAAAADADAAAVADAARYAAAAADAARYAAVAVAAAVAARYADADNILSLSAEIAVQALIECKSEGTAFLYLCD